MTKKDYKLITLALRSVAHPDSYDYALADGWPWGAYYQYHKLVLALVLVLASDNPRFDYAKFLAGCGVPKLMQVEMMRRSLSNSKVREG